MSNPTVRLALKRLLIVFVIGMIVTMAGNELLFRATRDPAARKPKVVELVIPPGTAAQLEQGIEIEILPEEMVFVAGDVLLVKNEDNQAHELGPLWIPANSSASMNLDEPMQYGLKCSFQPNSYMGLDVRPATTLWTRMQGLFLAGPATIIFLFLYSLLLYPLQPTKDEKQPSRSSDYVRQPPPPEKPSNGGGL